MWRWLLGAAALAAALIACSGGNESVAPPDDGGGATAEQEMASPGPSSDGATQTPQPTVRMCDDPQPPLITDMEVRQPVPLSEPPARTPFRDPVFGTCLVRVTDRKADLGPNDRSPGLKNEYSRIQSFNADGSRLVALGTDGAWYLYDAATLRPLGSIPIEIDPRWDATDPNRLYYTDGTRLMSLDVRTRKQSTVHDFAADFSGQSLEAVWSKYEGSPSRDGRYWGFMAEDKDWNPVAFVVYDLQENRVTARRDVRGVAGVENVDNTYVSPLGTYFIADFSDSYCERGKLGTDAKPCGYMVYDRNLKNGRGLLRISGHMDLAIDAGGREVAVFQDIDTDWISMVDLATGRVTPLSPIDFSHTGIGMHVSGRALNRPGWVVVSTYNGGNPTQYTWMDDQVFLLELKEGGRVVRLAHTRSVFLDAEVSYGEKDYWAEAHASANQDLTRIVFTSNWGRTGTEEVDMYMIMLPPDWLSRLP